MPVFMNPEIIGITAGALSCFTFAPQVYKTWKSGSSKDVSLSMFIVATVSTAFWLIYGLMINSVAIIGTNIIVLILSGTMLLLLLTGRRKSVR